MNLFRRRVSLKWNNRDGVGYLSLPDRPTKNERAGSVKRSIRLFDLDSSIKGIDLYIDLDEQNRVIGIEILE